MQLGGRHTFENRCARAVTFVALGKGNNSLSPQKWYGIDEMFIHPQRLGFQAEGQSHKLGEVEDGKVELAVHLSLPGIQVHLAEGASHDNSLGPNGLGVGQKRSPDW